MAKRGRPAGDGKGRLGGRKKGTPNKVTGDMREALRKALEGYVDKIPEYIEAIKDPKDKIDALAKMFPYVMPRLNNIDFEMKAKDGSKVGVFVEFADMSGEDKDTSQ